MTGLFVIPRLKLQTNSISCLHVLFLTEKFSGEMIIILPTCVTTKFDTRKKNCMNYKFALRAIKIFFVHRRGLQCYSNPYYHLNFNATFDSLSQRRKVLKRNVDKKTQRKLHNPFRVSSVLVFIIVVTLFVTCKRGQIQIVANLESNLFFASSCLSRVFSFESYFH